MDTKQALYLDLPDRIKDIFFEIDSGIVVELRKTDEEYSALWHETIKLQEDHPHIERFLESRSAVTLSAEEHAALIRYLELKHEMEGMERQRIYFRGHTDGFAYLKEIGAA
jgi:hypothetical protein